MKNRMKKEILSSAILLITVAFTAISCTQQADNSYIAEGSVDDSSANGMTIYIRKYDDNTAIDSTVVQNNRFVFKGTIDTAHFCRIDVNQEFGNLIVEPGHIYVNMKDLNNPASGTQMNDELSRLKQIEDSLYTTVQQKEEELRAAYPDKKEFTEQMKRYKEQLQQEMAKIGEQLMAIHNNDAIGFYLMYSSFIQELPLEAKWNALQQMGPWLKSTQAAQQLIQTVEMEKKSQVGMPFIDIKGTDENGKEVALADFVGKGNYVLVDMWASWCRPCRQEIPNLAKLHNLYHNKGLTVVGVFTWDQKENLTTAMQEEKITWNQIVDTEMGAMQKYGINGIPFIFLLSPDGIIVERGLRGEEMIQTVESYLNQKRSLGR